MNRHATIFHPLEIELLERIESCETCSSFGITAEKGESSGVLVHHRGRSVGLWSCQRGKLCFRSLSNRDVVHIADGIDVALAVTVGMASTSRWQA